MLLFDIFLSPMDICTLQQHFVFTVRRERLVHHQAGRMHTGSC